MAKYQHFEELPAWQTAAALYNLVLDLLEEHSQRFTPGFRSQLDRAALSVSNNIAEGFDRVTTNELICFLGYARGSAGEVRSMMRVVENRPKLRPVRKSLREIHDTADSCVRQLAAWTTQIEEGPIQGKRHLPREVKQSRRAETAEAKIRRQFLLSLTSEHPLYHTKEAREAREAEGMDA